MPHTNRRKKKTSVTKRIEITDEDGWTRVTTTNAQQRAPRSITALNDQSTDAENPWKTVPENGITIEKLRARYEEIEKQWLASDSCLSLQILLRDRVLTTGLKVDKCVIFGSSSFCGLRHGWIRNDVRAMCQLAVLRSMQVAIGNALGSLPPAFAQDPAYNDLDVEFLKSYNVATLETPDGFHLLTEKSLAYTPAAETHVEILALKAQPGILLTAKLDWYWRNQAGLACTSRVAVCPDGEDVKQGGQETPQVQGGAWQLRDPTRLEAECQIFEAFLRGRQEASLPDFDFKDHPFRNQHTYWLDEKEDGGVD